MTTIPYHVARNKDGLEPIQVHLDRGDRAQLNVQYSGYGWHTDYDVDAEDIDNVVANRYPGHTKTQSMVKLFDYWTDDDV